jgi:hypothetical protein
MLEGPKAPRRIRIPLRHGRHLDNDDSDQAAYLLEERDAGTVTPLQVLGPGPGGEDVG